VNKNKEDGRSDGDLKRRRRRRKDVGQVQGKWGMRTCYSEADERRLQVARTVSTDNQRNATLTTCSCWCRRWLCAKQRRHLALK